MNAKTLYLAMLFLVAVGTTACNTTRGVGQDVQAAGGAIEDTAEDVQDGDK